MLEHAAAWLRERYPHATGHTLLDAGCGTGLFSTAMAQLGFQVTAVDIAPRMVAAARQTAERAGVAERIQFLEGDTEAVTNEWRQSDTERERHSRFDAVACFDVLVHYPPEAFVPFCTHLAQWSDGPLLLTYAPYSRPLAALHWVGNFFPKGQRRTEIQMIRDAVVADTLADVGMRIRRSADISHGFYHVTLIEADRD